MRVAVIALVAAGLAGPGWATTPAAASPALAPTCAAGALTVTVATSASSFAPGQSIPFTVTAHNNGPVPCSPGGCAPTVQVQTSGGKLEWSSLPPGFGTCAFIGVIPAHGKLASSFSWNQRPNEPGCGPSTTCPPVGPGDYVATGYAGGHSSARLPFSIASAAPAQLPFTGLPFLPLLSAAIAALTAGVALLLRARRTRARQLTAG